MDGLQAGAKLRKLLAAAPGSDIAEAVFAGLDAEILADGIRDAFRLHLLGLAVFLFGRFLFGPRSGGFPFLFIIVQLGMGDLMDGGGDRLHLAHARPDHDPLFLRAEIAVHVLPERFYGNRNRGGAAQGLQKRFKLLDIPGQVAGQLGQGLALCLAHVKYLDRAEHGNLDLFFHGDYFPVLVQHGRFRIRVQLLFLDLFLKGGRGDDGDAMFALFHMALKLVAPPVIACHMGCPWHLHVDQGHVVDGIAVEPGHGGEVLPVLVAFKQVFDALLDALGDLPQPFFVGFLRFCHGKSRSFLGFWGADSIKETPAQTGGKLSEPGRSLIRSWGPNPVWAADNRPLWPVPAPPPGAAHCTAPAPTRSVSGR